jgi:predicted small integral membrane protein
MLVRQCKILMLICLAGFAFLVTFTNLMDFEQSHEFIRHVLSMDTTFSDNDAIYRAIESPMIWTAAYWLVIAGQGLTCALYLLAAFRMIRAMEDTSQGFQASKDHAVAATTAAFLVWFLGFAVIGGEWFVMWQSEQWNGQSAAFRFYMTALAVLIFVMQPDAELPGRRRR